MTCFFMADVASRGGVKASCHLADALAACGVHCVVVTPDGTVPQGVRASVAFAAETHAVGRVTAADTVVVSAARDVERMAKMPARLVFHARGPATAIGEAIADRSITAVLASSPATAAGIRQRTGRDPVELGMAIDDVFFQAGVRRVAGTVAFVPQASAGRAERCGPVPQLTMVPLDVVDEVAAAAVLQASEFYVAPEGDGDCGIGIPEALAAGCVVVGTTRSGGAVEILDGVTGIVAEEHDLRAVLREWAAPANRIERAAVRDRGRALAAAFRMAVLRRRVAALVAGPLAFVRS